MFDSCLFQIGRESPVPNLLSDKDSNSIVVNCIIYLCPCIDLVIDDLHKKDAALFIWYKCFTWNIVDFRSINMVTKFYHIVPVFLSKLIFFWVVKKAI